MNKNNEAATSCNKMFVMLTALLKFNPVVMHATVRLILLKMLTNRWKFFQHRQQQTMIKVRKLNKSEKGIIVGKSIDALSTILNKNQLIQPVFPRFVWFTNRFNIVKCNQNEFLIILSCTHCKRKHQQI